MIRWVILTGEYPPQPGGVSDYTRSVAAALGEAGDEVHVWAPPAKGLTPVDAGVSVRRLPDSFGPTSLRLLTAELDRLPAPRTLLLQFVPHAFGFRAMNIFFCRWAARRRRTRDRVEVMFHEVWFPPGGALKHQFLHIVTRWMARTLYRAADRVYVSIPAWADRLRDTGDLGPDPVWVPVPATVSYVDRPDLVAALRSRLFRSGRATEVIGHFSTYPPAIIGMLRPALVDLLGSRPRVRILLLGRGGERFRAALLGEQPNWTDRVIAPDGLPPDQLSYHLQCCDLMVQPLPDGVSTRRTTVMAALVNGVPLLTTFGAFSEPIWYENHSVELTETADPKALVDAISRLLDDRVGLAALGRRGRDLYNRRFALGHTIAALRGAIPSPHVGKD
jgi:glycosyltransferase involved in cell wall biosynthesis